MEQGFGFLYQGFIGFKIRGQVNQAAALQRGFPDGQPALFLAELSQKPPLTETGRFSAGIFELLARKFHAETASQQIGGDKGSRPADAEVAMNEDFLAEIDRFIQPLERLFHRLQGGRFIVRHRQVIDFKAEVCLNLMQITVLAT